MKNINLNYNEKRLILTLINHPGTKFCNQDDIFELNYMAALGLVNHAGGLRYEVTDDGINAYTASRKDPDLITDKKY